MTVYRAALVCLLTLGMAFVTSGAIIAAEKADPRADEAEAVAFFSSLARQSNNRLISSLALDTLPAPCAHPSGRTARSAVGTCHGKVRGAFES